MKQVSLFVGTLFCLQTVMAHAAAPELTFFSDGTLVQLETTTQKGVAEVALPSAIRENTLRVRPLQTAEITSVELQSAKVPERLYKEQMHLTEQKNRLEDRLKALDTREAIFAAAAKSQSSKAPRKTKANPDPLASVRQGTDFAIAQLEAVFTARRRTEQELKRVEARLQQLHKQAQGLPTVRITATPANARLQVTAVLTEGGWTPQYLLRLSGNGTASLILQTRIPAVPRGFHAAITADSLVTAKPSPPIRVPAAATGAVQVSSWQLPVEQEQVNTGPLPSFSLTLQNSSGIRLPAGKVAVYSNGEYVGSTQLPTSDSGSRISLTSVR